MTRLDEINANEAIGVALQALLRAIELSERAGMVALLWAGCGTRNVGQNTRSMLGEGQRYHS